MTRLDWGKPGERFYETGVDRGVLYIDAVGYAWSGLVSVAESLTGGEAKPRYIDGFKYANVAAAEEFEATINAFSAPREFGPCDGSVSVYNGLIATQQPRRPFDFSYRTKIGNDTEGADHAYKIHLVYNALAAPASRTYTTLGQENSPQTLSWRLTTLPPKITGLKPTAHFVIDTRTAPLATLEEIENILYGDAGTNAAMPTVAELMAIFNG